MTFETLGNVSGFIQTYIARLTPRYVDLANGDQLLVHALRLDHVLFEEVLGFVGRCGVVETSSCEDESVPM